MGIVLNPELESRIAAKVESGRYHSADEVIEEGLALLEARDEAPPDDHVAQDSPIWETIARLGESIPGEAWDKVPVDLSRNLDHYLYGASRRSK